MDITVDSLVASKTREGAVEIAFDDRKIQMSIEDARGIGLWLLQAAEAAQTDAMVFEILEGAGPKAQFGMIQALRDLRRKQREEADRDRA